MIIVQNNITNDMGGVTLYICRLFNTTILYEAIFLTFTKINTIKVFVNEASTVYN